MKKWVCGVISIALLMSIAACQSAEEIPPSSTTDSLAAPASSSDAVTSAPSNHSTPTISENVDPSTTSDSSIQTSQYNRSTPIMDTSIGAESSISDTGTSSVESDFADSENVMESLGIYYNEGQSVYWLTDIEASGFLELFNQLEFEKGIVPVPPGQGNPTKHFELHYVSGDWKYIFVDLHGLYHYKNEKPTAFILKDGQTDIVNKLLQYLQNLDSIQDISELKHIS